jgi:hypothetical protein
LPASVGLFLGFLSGAEDEGDILLETSLCLRNTWRYDQEDRTLYQGLQKQHGRTEVVPETLEAVCPTLQLESVRNMRMHQN